MLQTAILVGVVGRVTVLNSGPKFDCKRSIAFLCSPIQLHFKWMSNFSFEEAFLTLRVASLNLSSNDSSSNSPYFPSAKFQANLVRRVTLQYRPRNYHCFLTMGGF